MVQFQADLCMCASHLSRLSLFLWHVFLLTAKTNQPIELEDHPSNLYGSCFSFFKHEVFKQMITLHTPGWSLRCVE